MSYWKRTYGSIYIAKSKGPVRTCIYLRKENFHAKFYSGNVYSKHGQTELCYIKGSFLPIKYTIITDSTAGSFTEWRTDIRTQKGEKSNTRKHYSKAQKGKTKKQLIRLIRQQQDTLHMLYSISIFPEKTGKSAVGRKTVPAEPNGAKRPNIDPQTGEQ